MWPLDTWGNYGHHSPGIILSYWVMEMFMPCRRIHVTERVLLITTGTILSMDQNQWNNPGVHGLINHINPQQVKMRGHQNQQQHFAYLWDILCVRAPCDTRQSKMRKHHMSLVATPVTPACFARLHDLNPTQGTSLLSTDLIHRRTYALVSRIII